MVSYVEPHYRLACAWAIAAAAGDSVLSVVAVVAFVAVVGVLAQPARINSSVMAHTKFIKSSI